MKDIKIKDMEIEAQEYMKAWEFNGLLIFASVGEYDDGKEMAEYLKYGVVA